MTCKLKIKLDLRLEIYFKLTLAQQRKLNASYSWSFIEQVPMSEFRRITRSKVLSDKLIELKRLCIREVA
jgi:hypothetical protein